MALKPSRHRRCDCRQRDGLSLAIKLAAARLRILTPPALAQRAARRQVEHRAGREAARLAERHEIDAAFEALHHHEAGCGLRTDDFTCRKRIAKYLEMLGAHQRLRALRHARAAAEDVDQFTGDRMRESHGCA
ncbi:MAG TPA: hypothetical protein VGI14_22815 [Casimicrobiaceae bacterium]